MAYARVSYLGDGSTKIYTVPFPYISPEYVEVRVGGVLKSVTVDYTWLTTSTIQFGTAPINGAQVLLKRNTNKLVRLVNFQDGTILKEETLDLSAEQTFHIVQETLDETLNVRTVETFVAGVGYTPGVSTSVVLAGGGDAEGGSTTVLFDGATQQVTEYTLIAGTLTFNNPVPVGVAQIQVSYAVPLAGGFPDNSLTTAKFMDGSVTNPKLGALAVTQDKLAEAIFSALTAVAPATGDYLPISDVSDAGKKKKALVSDILGLIANAGVGTLGLAQFASSGEVTAGTVTNKAVSPADLNRPRAFFTNGYQQFPGNTSSLGLIIQWVRTANLGDFPGGVQQVDITLPVTFPSAMLLVAPSHATSSGHTASTANWDIAGSTLSTARVKYAEYTATTQGTNYITIFAIGY